MQTTFEQTASLISLLREKLSTIFWDHINTTIPTQDTNKTNSIYDDLLLMLGWCDLYLTRTIQLTKEYVTIVDEQDFEKLSKYQWCERKL